MDLKIASLASGDVAQSLRTRIILAKARAL
jgi:hypothetical protein